MKLLQNIGQCVTTTLAYFSPLLWDAMLLCFVAWSTTLAWSDAVFLDIMWLLCPVTKPLHALQKCITLYTCFSEGYQAWLDWLALMVSLLLSFLYIKTIREFRRPDSKVTLISSGGQNKLTSEASWFFS